MKLVQGVARLWWSPVEREREREREGTERPNSNTNRFEGGISRKGGEEDTGRNMPDIGGILSSEDDRQLGF